MLIIQGKNREGYGLKLKQYKNYLLTSEIIEGAENILGLFFYDLKNYFKKTFYYRFRQTRCSSFVTRRCFLLSSWFLHYIEMQDTDDKEVNQASFCVGEKYYYIEKNGIRNYIVSDKSDVIMVLDACPDIKTIVLNDDISIRGIHLGNAVNSLFALNSNDTEGRLQKIDELKKELHTDKIEVSSSVYMCSSESAVTKPTEWEVLSGGAEWRVVSQKIVDFINYLNLPYVSFINSYTKFNVEEEDFKKIIEAFINNGSLICEEFGKDDNREYNGKKSYFIIEKFMDCMEEEYAKCIRFYYNEPTKSLLIIPYVILDNLNSYVDELNAINNIEDSRLVKYLSEYFIDGLPKEIIDYIYSIKEKAINEKSCIYNLASCIASQAHGISFISKFLPETYYEIFEKEESYVQDIIDCISLSFGRDIFEFIKKGEIFRKKVNTSLTHRIDKTLFNNCLKTTRIKLGKGVGIESWTGHQDSSTPERDTSLKQVIKDAYEDGDGDEISFRYAYILQLISYCDIGRMNIACTKNTCASTVKSGELGCIFVEEFLREDSTLPEDKEQKNKIKELLKDKYYRYLFL